MKYVLYHGNCYDGFGAAFVAWKQLGDEGVVYRPCDYAEKAGPLEAIEDGAEVYVLDFSFPRAALEAAYKRLRSLVVLDHHKTAQADLEGLHFCKFDMQKSGAMLAWEYFHDGPPPSLIDHIQDRDLWRFALPGTRSVHAYLLATPFDFYRWNLLKIGDMVTEGLVMLNMQQAQVEKICQATSMVTLGGHVVPAVNTCMHFSEVPELLLSRYPKAKFAAYWYDKPKGKGSQELVRQWGLRSRGDFDVGAVAKEYGGGGHLAAAGFVVPFTLAVEGPQ